MEGVFYRLQYRSLKNDWGRDWEWAKGEDEHRCPYNPTISGYTVLKEAETAITAIREWACNFEFRIVAIPYKIGDPEVLLY